MYNYILIYTLNFISDNIRYKIIFFVITCYLRLKILGYENGPRYLKTWAPLHCSKGRRLFGNTQTFQI